MKTKTINLYEYSELSDLAKKKALYDWNETNDDPYMQPHMINLLKEKLDERGIKYDTDSINVYYSLSYCQGDGFMFEGILQWKGTEVHIKHQGHYYHSNSKQVSWYDKEGNECDPAREASFEKMYQEVCKEMEDRGYEHIEWITSAEVFEETCYANEWTFREDGKMENA